MFAAKILLGVLIEPNFAAKSVTTTVHLTVSCLRRDFVQPECLCSRRTTMHRCSNKSSTRFFVAIRYDINNTAAVRYHVSEGTLKCLLALPLRVREDERARAKARVKSKNRKRRREGSVEAGLMEADARVDDDIRAKCQADALHEVRLYAGCWWFESGGGGAKTL